MALLYSVYMRQVALPVAALAGVAAVPAAEEPLALLCEDEILGHPQEDSIQKGVAWSSEEGGSSRWSLSVGGCTCPGEPLCAVAWVGLRLRVVAEDGRLVSLLDFL